MQKAAYQVGLTFLTSHMRRAVAACTSPEVFFGANVSGLAAGSSSTADTDALNLAMGSLDMNTAIAPSV
jgi:alpha,alpha-trehalase